MANRNGNEASGTASLVTGITFGQGFKWRPELEIGYRNVFSGTAGSTTANFQQTGAVRPSPWTPRASRAAARSPGWTSRPTPTSTS